MKVLLVLVIAVSLSFTSGAPGEDKKHGHGPGKGFNFAPKCLGEDLKSTDEMKATMKTCHEKYMPMKKMDKSAGGGKKDSTKEPNKGAMMKNMTCIRVCEFQAAGIISTEGVLEKDKIAAHIKIVFPEAVQATLTTEVSKCVDEKAAGVELKDGKCEVFQPFNKCVFEAIGKVCKTETPKDDEQDEE